MNLGLSMDALSSRGNVSWRLQSDLQHWQPCPFASDIGNEDALLESPGKAERWIGQRMKTDKNLGLKPTGRPGMLDFWMRGIFAYPIMHRFSPAPIPEKSQMVDTIARLIPGTAWLPYLDLGGNFRTLDSAHSPIIGNMDIAVRGEIASSPAYVGTQATANERLMDEMYRQFLAGWLEHLKSRRLGVFVPDIEKLKDEDVLKQGIETWQHE